MPKDYDLFIKYPEKIGTKTAKEIDLCGQLISKNVQVNRYTPQLKASGYLDALVTYIIFKPMIDGFLKELGAEGARSLKETLCDLITKIKRKPFYNVTEQSLNKVEKANKLAKKRGDNLKKAELDNILEPVEPLAISIQITEDYHVDFIFPHKTTAKQARTALSRIKPKILSHQLISEALAEALPNLEVKYGQDYVQSYLVHSAQERIYTQHDGEWRILSKNEMLVAKRKPKKSKRAA